MIHRRADPSDACAANLFPTRRATDNLARLRRQWAEQVASALGGDVRRVGLATEVLNRLESVLIADRLGHHDSD